MASVCDGQRTRSHFLHQLSKKPFPYEACLVGIRGFHETQFFGLHLAMWTARRLGSLESTHLKTTPRLTLNYRNEQSQEDGNEESLHFDREVVPESNLITFVASSGESYIELWNGQYSHDKLQR